MESRLVRDLRGEGARFFYLGREAIQGQQFARSHRLSHEPHSTLFWWLAFSANYLRAPTDDAAECQVALCSKDASGISFPACSCSSAARRSSCDKGCARNQPPAAPALSCCTHGMNTRCSGTSCPDRPPERRHGQARKCQGGFLSNNRNIDRLLVPIGQSRNVDSRKRRGTLCPVRWSVSFLERHRARGRRTRRR